VGVFIFYFVFQAANLNKGKCLQWQGWIMDFKTAKLQDTRLNAMPNGVSPGLQNWTDFGIWGLQWSGRD